MIYDLYLITNKINDKKYVGYTSIGYQERFKQHIYEANKLKTGRILCKAIRKYPIDSFEVKLLYQTVLSDEAFKLEIDYIQLYKTHAFTKSHNGYNMSLGGDSNKGYKHSEETKEKLKIAKSGQNSYFFGKHLTEEHKKKLSDAKIGLKKTDTTKRNMSNSRKKSIIQIDKYTMEIISEFPSIKEAFEITKIDHISDVCNGKRKTAGGYIWEFKNKN
jgi:group I intron endonuclease